MFTEAVTNFGQPVGLGHMPIDQELDLEAMIQKIEAMKLKVERVPGPDHSIILLARGMHGGMEVHVSLQLSEERAKKPDQRTALNLFYYILGDTMANGGVIGAC